MDHPSDQEIEDFAMNRLAPAQLPPMEEHLLVCERCRARVSALEEYAETMRRALAELPAKMPGG